jgi:hypothetical protein
MARPPEDPKTERPKPKGKPVSRRTPEAIANLVAMFDAYQKGGQEALSQKYYELFPRKQ